VSAPRAESDWIFDDFWILEEKTNHNQVAVTGEEGSDDRVGR
jgi:hypothetical protein